MIDLQRMLEMQQLANVNNDSEGDFQSNPFAFSYPSFEPTPYVEPALAQYFPPTPTPYIEPALAQYFTPAAPAASTYIEPVAAPASVSPAMLAPVAAPVIQAAAPTGSRRGDVQPAPTGPSNEQIQEGIVDVPKPPEILALEKKLGREVVPIYAQGTISRGRGGASQTLDYGPPIGYRYDNGQSQYVNFDTSGQQTSIQERGNNLAPLLAILAAAYLGPMAFDALGLTGAGGAGLLADTAALGAGEVASLTPLTFTPEMIAAGAFTPGSIGAYGAAQGLLTAEQLAAAYGLLSQTPFIPPTATPGTPPPPNLELPPPIETPIPSGPPSTPGTPPPPNLEPPVPLEPQYPYQPPLETPPLEPEYPYQPPLETPPIEEPIPSGPPSTPGTPPPPNVGPPGSNIPFSLPSWATIPNALLAANVASSIAKANETTPTAAPFTMAPYVPPSGKPFANLGMSPIATPYTPTRILGQYDPTMTPGGVSPYELIMQQMQAPQNLYANFEAGTNIGGFDPQRFVLPPAAAATALPNNMGGMIDKSRMIGPNPMGPDNGFASIQDGEFVMNRKATAKYGIDLMNAINSGKISKGKLSGLLEA
jgi:hypothetical protein